MEPQNKLKHILVVGKDNFTRVMIGRYLHRKGFRVVMVETNEQALQKATARKSPWHAVIADDDPGFQSAHEVLRLLEDRKVRSSHSIILDSSHETMIGNSHTVKRLSKPILPNLLLESLL